METPYFKVKVFYFDSHDFIIYCIRVTYVAQSPLEYLNLHLDKTPNEYVQWRYKNGEDEELVMKQSRKMTPEEAEQMQKSITGKNGQQRRIEAIVGRAKLKKSFQYEVKWIGLADKHNSWIPREKLDEWGFQKLVQSFDDKMAGRYMYIIILFL